MSNVRKSTISNAEKQFLVKNLTEWTRLDGRAFHEYRNVEIEFGRDWGCCYVSLGKTRVVAQVSCELQVPKSSRPSEGILNINLELNTMGDPNFDPGRQSELSSQLNRLLEKCIKDSKAVDLESLCVKMNERVWSIRVDVNLLNHEGNILDCASIATLAALAHFRRPDVTCDGMEFKIHSLKERDPIPTVLHHYPVCISYAIFSGGDFVVADSTFLEEGVAEAFLTVGMNAYKELCGLHLGGKVQLSTDVILETTSKAAKRAGEVIEMIKAEVEKDTKLKVQGQHSGFQAFNIDNLDAVVSELDSRLDHWETTKGKKKKNKMNKMEVDHEETDVKEETKPAGSIKSLGNGTAELVPNENVGRWHLVESDDDGGASGEDDIVYVEPPKVETVDIDDLEGSEEESVVVIKPDQTKSSPKKKQKPKS